LSIEQEISIMKRGVTILALTALAVVALSSVALTLPSPALAGGATQISGIGYDGTGQCTEMDADLSLIMYGDLEGCLYTFIESAEVSPSGTYRETGTETFVGWYNGKRGTFDTTYRFTAKYGDLTDPATEIFGRCQHPIVKDSGTGVFAGVTGRLDFKDNIQPDTIDFPYRGHLRY
jgi:hypothetical protein